MGEIYPNPVIYLAEEISPGYCAVVPVEPDLMVCEGVRTYIPRNPKRASYYPSLSPD
jgi:hypothetical protein